MRPLRAVTALLGLALAGSLAAGVGPATAAAADPLYGAPAAGSCHDATFDQAKGDTLTVPVVPCSADHTLVTTKVVPLPADVDLSDWDQVSKAYSCASAENRLIGRNPLRRALTLYSTFVFLPTAEQQAAGARWVSCHLTVWDTKGLNDLPTKLPKLKRKPAASVAKCATRRAFVTCAEKHTWRAALTDFARAKGSDKAVERRVAKLVPTICASTGSSGRYSFRRWTPSKVLVTCYRKTKR